MPNALVAFGANRHYETDNFADCLSSRQESFVTEEAESNAGNLIELTADVVSAFVSNNPVPVGDLPALISQIHAALKGTAGGGAAPDKSGALKPAVPIKKSVTPDYIVSLEDGKKFKSLKRHLATHHNLTPDEYRTRWGLPADYPMVAPNYAAARSALAKTMGLGRKPKEPEKPAPVKRTRTKTAA
ncbi:MucR family transcriptional regulator [Mesorhizobium sp. M7A.F.Ca.US.011.01.1.1]|nr:MucR family transcriptional regulator [Mesorhizobium sp. M7A.F.Ca.US.011.01.1.1]